MARLGILKVWGNRAKKSSEIELQTLYFCRSYYIRYRGAVYADMGHFERCITLWMYALDMQQKILEPLSPMTQSSLLSFAELFSFMMSEGGGFSKLISIFY